MKVCDIYTIGENADEALMAILHGEFAPRVLQLSKECQLTPATLSKLRLVLEIEPTIIHVSGKVSMSAWHQLERVIPHVVEHRQTNFSLSLRPIGFVMNKEAACDLVERIREVGRPHVVAKWICDE